ncbi:MAG: DEAD/DEAH box helicase, partial [Methanimicrococcus sp.]|nr:DEAD/DEAH box helicase [Methanimicrococcus sp.]
MASESKKQFIEHPLIFEGAVEQRLYQLNIVSGCTKKNSLVVLPTSLGKTIVALLIMVMRLEKIGGKVLLLSPTKPLVEQHFNFFSRVLKPKAGNVRIFMGGIAPDKRRDLWGDSSVIIATPQVIENDLINGRISLKDVSCIVFDEAHRSVGNYAYTYVAEKYMATADNPLILGITASPGSEKETIDEV